MAVGIPHDLLPIVRPLEDTTKYKPTYFYNNVVKWLIPDIILLKLTGIPINLDKVKEVKDTVDNVLDNVNNTLSNSPIIKQFLKELDNKKDIEERKKIESKVKTKEDFRVNFDIHNKIHRSYVINQHLVDIGKPEEQMLEWSKKDVQKLAHILGTNFLTDYSNNLIKPYMLDTIQVAMDNLAKDKETHYRSNLASKLTKRLEMNRSTFNPASSLQKANLFDFLGIKSESTTKGGKDKWDRKELQRLSDLLKLLIEEKQ